MPNLKLIDRASPAKHFAFGPYRAELFSTDTGWSGVMNNNGLNVLTFKGSGSTITDFETAKKIADIWNKKMSDTRTTKS